MTVKKVKVPINTLEELVANPEYQAGIPFGGSSYSLFKVRAFLLKVLEGGGGGMGEDESHNVFYIPMVHPTHIAKFC